jgi:hypothetical protein
MRVVALVSLVSAVGCAQLTDVDDFRTSPIVGKWKGTMTLSEETLPIFEGAKLGVDMTLYGDGSGTSTTTLEKRPTALSVEWKDTEGDGVFELRFRCDGGCNQKTEFDLVCTPSEDASSMSCTEPKAMHSGAFVRLAD